MIGKTETSLGLGRIAVAVRQPLDSETVDVYHDALAFEFDLKEWERFTRWAVQSGRFTWFPKLRELQDALREFRGDRPMLAEATEAYDRVLGAGTYCPEGGTTWDYRSIRERCGEAAAEAFLAAGGNNAFGNTFRESDRRERFIAAYGDAARESPASRLLPAGPTKALPPAEAPPARDEALALVQRVKDLADVKSPRNVLTTEEWEARRKVIERQAREMQET